MMLTELHSQMLFDELDNKIAREKEFMPVRMLKATLRRDGNQYCWLLGDNLQEGIAGFGDTPYLAMLDFNKSFYTTRIPVAEEAK